MDFNKILKILGKAKFLAHLPEEEQNKFIRDCRQINLKAGEPLFYENDLGTSMYVVLSGEVSIYKGDAVIAKRGRGELFGELSLIESTPRSATIKSTANTSLLEITKEQFDTYFASNSKILLSLLKIIAKRFIVDINKMDSVYQGIRVYARELEESNSDLQSFAYIASHDLQEPLRKIMAFGDRLNAKTPQLDNEGKDYLSRMQTSAERMKRLIDDILKYSNVTAQATLFEHVDLKTIIDEVLLDLEDQIEKTCGEIKLNEMPSLEAIPFQMRQLFQNLISNSLKYNRKGVRPVVNITSSVIEDNKWNIIIEDNGIGIEEKYFDRVFKMFERLHGRKSYEGTGIGLAICKKIVRRHGGEIALEKPDHEGTKINITLPTRQNFLEEAITPS